MFIGHNATRRTSLGTLAPAATADPKVLGWFRLAARLLTWWIDRQWGARA